MEYFNNQRGSHTLNRLQSLEIIFRIILNHVRKYKHYHSCVHFRKNILFSIISRIIVNFFIFFSLYLSEFNLQKMNINLIKNIGSLLRILPLSDVTVLIIPQILQEVDTVRHALFFQSIHPHHSATDKAL